MANGIENNNFDRFLEKMENGLDVAERRKVNHAGADVYKDSMKQFLDSHRSNRVYLDGQNHLADTLTKQSEQNGAVDIGFSKAGKKAYIARFLNDGWESKNQYGGPYRRVQPAEWHDFFKKIGVAEDSNMAKAMEKKAKSIIDRKAGV